MIESKNLVTLTGGITRDPEILNDNVVKFSLAIDYASSDKSNNTGYFDITYFLSNDNKRNADFVRSQLNEQKMKKGSQISLVGRLVQDRWQDEKSSTNRSKVYIVAESISYASGGAKKDAPSVASSSAGQASAIEDF